MGAESFNAEPVVPDESERVEDEVKAECQVLGLRTGQNQKEKQTQDILRFLMKNADVCKESKILMANNTKNPVEPDFLLFRCFEDFLEGFGILLSEESENFPVYSNFFLF